MSLNSNKILVAAGIALVVWISGSIFMAHASDVGAPSPVSTQEQRQLRTGR